MASTEISEIYTNPTSVYCELYIEEKLCAMHAASKWMWSPDRGNTAVMAWSDRCIGKNKQTNKQKTGYFAMKVPNIKMSLSGLQKKESMFLTYTKRFKTILARIFQKFWFIGRGVCLNTLPNIFPYPGLGGTPTFFANMRVIMVMDALTMCLMLYPNREKIFRVCKNHPGYRKVIYETHLRDNGMIYETRVWY